MIKELATLLFAMVPLSGLNGCGSKMHNADVFKEEAAQKLVAAACSGKGAAISLLVRQGTDVDIRGEKGITPLIWALQCDNLAGVTALLENGADPNLTSEYYQLPLSLAARKQDQNFMRVLLKHGADVNGDTKNQNSWPLDEARNHAIFDYPIEKGEVWDNFDFVIKNGADINTLYDEWMAIGDTMVATRRYAKALELLEMGYHTNLDSMLEVARGQAGLVSDDVEPDRLKLIKILEAKGIKGVTPKIDPTPDQ